MQSLLVRQFQQTPREQWPQVERQLAQSFAPLEIKLLRMDQAELTAPERARLTQGQNVVRIADWGYYDTALAPLDRDWLVSLYTPPDPLDINLLSWGVTVLIGAAMLGCLLLWVWPHWRDLERLKETARRLGQGQMAERTHISPRSNIGELAGVFDTMASDRAACQSAARAAQCGVPRVAHTADSAGFRPGAVVR